METPQYAPYNQEAEQGVLGAVFLEPGALSYVIENLNEDDFFEMRNKYMFRALQTMYDKRVPVDVTTMSNTLKELELLEKVGGANYVVELVDKVYAIANIEAYVDIVRKFTLLRSLVGMAQSVMEHGRNENIDANDLLEEVEQQVLKIGSMQNNAAYHDIRTVVNESLEYIETLRKNDKHVTGLTTGFHDLDKMTAGLHGSELIIVGARPSMGKTAFALNLSSNVARENEKATVAIFSLEMSAQQLVMRLLSSESRINSERLRSGNLNSEEFNRLTIGANKLASMNILIDDSPGITIGEIRSKCRRMKQEHGLDMVMIDYLQLIHANIKVGNRQEEVSFISRNLKALARELDVPVIALSQLSRAVESRPDKRPMMSDIRESGSIEQDADIVAFLYREDYYDKETDNKDTIEIIIGKQRNGPVGTVSLVFKKDFNAFLNHTSYPPNDNRGNN